MITKFYGDQTKKQLNDAPVMRKEWMFQPTKAYDVYASATTG